MVVQENLGHAKVSTTLDLYAHVMPSTRREAADALAALLG
jgi:integrase